MQNETKRGTSARKPPGYNKRLKPQRELDILFCTNLFLRGYSYREIAKHLNDELKRRGETYELSFQMVYYDMRQVLEEWKAEQKQNITDYVAQELKKLDRMEAELWEAWEKSKKIVKKKTRRSREGSHDPEDKAIRPGDWGYSETQEENTPGDSRYFDLLLRVWDKRAKLVGYDVAEKVKIIRDDDEEEDDFNLDDVDDETLVLVADKMANSLSAKLHDKQNEG